MTLRRSRICERTHRLIASRYPTVAVFDDLTDDEEELRVAFLLESATNDRHRLLASRLSLLPPGEVVSGPTASIVMAAFLHADTRGGRFTDGRLGAWYASFGVQTAIVETLYHSERRLRLSEGAFPSAIQIRELIARPDVTLCDIRGEQETRPELYGADPACYPVSQVFAARLRWPDDGAQGENGLIYDSVRHEGGTSLCLFSPSLIPLPVLQGDHYEYRWDARGDVAVVKLSNVTV
jgi:hypothetical protein